MLERRLINAINSGTCFVLYGAGPSCELGLPSWRELAQKLLESLGESYGSEFKLSCNTMIEENMLPEVFSELETVLGRDVVLEKIQQFLIPTKPKGDVYTYLSNWPFACYLTTNYEEYINNHFVDKKSALLVRCNELNDFHLLDANAKSILFKIHGGFEKPATIILTSRDYQELRTSDDKRYWREKIKSVMHMVPLLIVGYSAKDPDFQEQLEIVKEIISPDRPIYMIASDMGADEAAKLLKEYNIRVVSYKNTDGTHSELRRLLRRYNQFIANRGSKDVGLEPVNEEEATLAASLHIFTKLNAEAHGRSCLEKSYESLVVSTLYQYRDGLDVAELARSLKNAIHSKVDVDGAALQESLESLRNRGYIEYNQVNSFCLIKAAGILHYEELAAKRVSRKELFQRSCSALLRSENSSITDDQIDRIVNAATEGLVAAFKLRGIELAKMVFTEERVRLTDSDDIVKMLNERCLALDTDLERMAYIDLMITVISNASDEMLGYLVDLSQGYFAFHSLGMDPSCSQERLSHLSELYWIIDSSILLHLLSKGSTESEYANDLLGLMKRLGLTLFTTRRLFDEVIEHVSWAIRIFTKSSGDPREMLLHMTSSAVERKNLFVESYFSWARQHPNPDMEYYLDVCFGEDRATNLRRSVENILSVAGINVIEFSDYPGFRDELWNEVNDAVPAIEEIRRGRDTFKRDEQCVAEAEVLVLCRSANAAFLSHSTVVDAASNVNKRLCWSPEQNYRLLSSLSDVLPSDNMLYQTMVDDLFRLGMEIFDADSIKEYFGGQIRQARMSFEHERKRYIDVVSDEQWTQLQAGFDGLRDEYKPFYSTQLDYYLARRENEKRRLAEERAKVAEQAVELTKTERADYQRLKAKEAEKRMKARKRNRANKNEKNKKSKRAKKSRGGKRK